jgi:hypothetical protein
MLPVCCVGPRILLFDRGRPAGTAAHRREGEGDLGRCLAFNGAQWTEGQQGRASLWFGRGCRKGGSVVWGMSGGL